MPKHETSCALVWFRNDLRVRDQHSLYKACENHDKVIALYCIDPRHFEYDNYGFRRTGPFRTKFLLDTLGDLKSRLNDLNISLFVFHAKPEDQIPEFCKTFGIDHIYFQNEWTEYEQNVEQALRNWLDTGITLKGSYDQFLYHPEDIPIPISEIPEVFTSFRKRIEKNCQIRPLVEISQKPKNNLIENHSLIPSLQNLGYHDIKIPVQTAFPFSGGENSALERLQNYFFKTGNLANYKKTRNGLLGTDYSSKFSPWLANGSLSARMVYWAVKRFEKAFKKSDSTYWMIFELIWRDYFKYVSMRYGKQIFSLAGIKNIKRDWRTDYKDVRRWINGETDSDFVNANMIELKQTGWMSNRGRQNVASYLAKTLKVDWRIGAAYFESMLVDYDVDSNYGNWMYVAGVGNDPRDRTFNVELQADRYDHNHAFRSRWLNKNLFS
ncbi:MAG: DASH family cryptochrome [Flavobacteriaceae bacterium]|nr:DASH family cryptochrome [Bacteroidia bacterium]NNF74535.1 DASH family cryptochrome [Flavobacteriaceae bacterium]NNK72610.1 DASH family cryptochrome [Flavobacteriaceae bacterium]